MVQCDNSSHLNQTKAGVEEDLGEQKNTSTNEMPVALFFQDILH
jgi:hypothetical protein